MSTRKQPQPAKGAKRLSWKANLLFAAVILTAAVLLVFLLRPRSKAEPLAAVVDFGSGITEVLPLDKDYDYLYDVGSYVVHLQVKDGTISFQDSQCPDHVCEKFGQLSEEGAWAACVPAGVYVKLAPLSEAVEGSGNQQEHLRFAISEDAKNWYALNDNQPVIASDSISTSGGIRDPHILRGEDGCYYIVATDMNTVKNGWKDNPGIVLMKSKDLVNWTHSKIVLKEDYKEHFSDAYWVWAPQTIYDKKAKKYMIYFTLQRTGDGRKSLVTYYAYANKDFTGFESEPKVLFNAKYGCIDNDIIERNGVYHMFYKGNIKNAEGKEIQNGIQQATAKNLKGPWKEDFKFIDAYADSKTGVEGSGVFKLNDKNEYVLMYTISWAQIQVLILLVSLLQLVL